MITPPDVSTPTPPEPPSAPAAENTSAVDSTSSASYRYLRDADKEPDSVLAIGVSFSPSAFGKNGLMAGAPESAPMGTSLQLEFQPFFLRYFGTIGVGPVFSAFPLYSQQEKASGLQAVWSVGAAARYRYHFEPSQLLIPYVGYQYNKLSYSFANGQQGSMDVKGPIIGVELLLSDLDSKHAESFSEESKVPSIYLSLEMRDLRGGDEMVKVSSPGWYFGFGVEL